MRKTWMVVPVILTVVMVVGCSKPPQQELDAVNAAMDEARAAEASNYATDSYQAAEDAKAQLEAELKAQEEKFALFRSYSRAKELAAEAEAKAEQAASDAAAGKARAMDEATMGIADATSALEAARAALNKAPRGKGTQADLAMMSSDLDGVASTIEEAQAAFDAGSYLEAKSKAEAAMSSANTVLADVEAAVAARRR